MITKPQNVYVMRDIMATGYVAGGNCQFFGMDKTNQWVRHGYEGNVTDATKTQVSQELYQRVKESINERLSFHDDASGEYASMMAFLCPYSEVTSGYRDQVISLSERLLPWEVTRHTTNSTKDYFPGGQTGFNSYKEAVGLNQLHFGEDVRAVENMEFISQGSVNNALCFIGPHRRYNPFSSNFFELIPGQGHFGPDAIPGVSSAHIQTLSVPLKPHRPQFQCVEQQRSSFGRTHGGGVERACRCARRAARWSASRSRRTRCSRCVPSTGRRRKPLRTGPPWAGERKREREKERVEC